MSSSIFAHFRGHLSGTWSALWECYPAPCTVVLILIYGLDRSDLMLLSVCLRSPSYPFVVARHQLQNMVLTFFDVHFESHLFPATKASVVLLWQSCSWPAVSHSSTGDQLLLTNAFFLDAISDKRLAIYVIIPWSVCPVCALYSNRQNISTVSFAPWQPNVSPRLC